MFFQCNDNISIINRGKILFYICIKSFTEHGVSSLKLQGEKFIKKSSGQKICRYMFKWNHTEKVQESVFKSR